MEITVKKYTYQQAVEHALKLYPQHTVECVPFTSMKISTSTKQKLDAWKDHLELRVNRKGKTVIQSRQWNWSLQVRNEADINVVLTVCQSIADKGESLSVCPIGK